jgi:hypothetical protein
VITVYGGGSIGWSSGPYASQAGTIVQAVETVPPSPFPAEHPHDPQSGPLDAFTGSALALGTAAVAIKVRIDPRWLCGLPPRRLPDLP